MNSRRICIWKIILLLVLCAALFITPMFSSNPGKESPARLTEFYTVDVWDDDFYPYWQSEIIHMTAQEGGVKLQCIYIASATQPCDDPAVKGVTAFFPRKELEDLTNGLYLCRIDASSFNQNVEKYARKPETFETVRSAVVAICGDEARVFRMPKFKMNDKLLKKREPSAQRMRNLSFYLLKQAFPIDKVRDVWWGGDSILSGIAADSPQIVELNSGRLNEAYWFGSKGAPPGLPAQTTVTAFDPTLGSDSDLGKLRNVLARYKRPSSGLRGRTGTLVDSQGYKLTRYVAPIYPPLAVQARIQGKVTLSLTVNRLTGQVEDAEVLNGHVLLKFSSLDSARKWQFDPSQGLPSKIDVLLDFSIHCGN
jgi:TonB family protein